MTIDAMLRDTTPQQLSDLDHEELQVRGQRRRAGTRLAGAAAALVVAVAGVAGVTTLTRPSPPDIAEAPAGPDIAQVPGDPDVTESPNELGIAGTLDKASTVEEGLALLEQLADANPGFEPSGDLVVERLLVSGGFEGGVPGRSVAWGEALLHRATYRPDGAVFDQRSATVAADVPNGLSADEVAEYLAGVARSSDTPMAERPDASFEPYGDGGVGGDRQSQLERAQELAGHRDEVALHYLTSLLTAATSGEDLRAGVAVLREMASDDLTWTGPRRDPLLGEVLELDVHAGEEGSTTLLFDAETGDFEGSRSALVVDGEPVVHQVTAVMRRLADGEIYVADVPTGATVSTPSDATPGDGAGNMPEVVEEMTEVEDDAPLTEDCPSGSHHTWSSSPDAEPMRGTCTVPESAIVEALAGLETDEVLARLDATLDATPERPTDLAALDMIRLDDGSLAATELSGIEGSDDFAVITVLSQRFDPSSFEAAALLPTWKQSAAAAALRGLERGDADWRFVGVGLDVLDREVLVFQSQTSGHEVHVDADSGYTTGTLVRGSLAEMNEMEEMDGTEG